MRFPTQQLILEGPDLSGKTTLYSNLHKATDYRWNIHDRSTLSMIVYAKHYKRDTFELIESLKKELYDLNNRFVMLMPEWSMIAKRYTSRGDELHNLISLKQTYDIFKEAIEEFENYPNVMVARAEDCIDHVIHNLLCIENASLKDIQQQVYQLATCSKNQEAIGVNFTIYDDGKFESVDEEALDYESEKDYYERIKTHVCDTIDNEIAGKNQYNRKETKESRRFIFAEDTCIALANFNYRKDCLDCHFVLRSSNVRDTLYYDLNFLYDLAGVVHRKLKLTNKVYCKMRFTINSAHIPNIID